MSTQFLDFSKIKPKGLPNLVKLCQYQPNQGQGNYLNNDIIRFVINTDGYWNPYCAYVAIDVDVTDWMTNAMNINNKGQVQQVVDTTAHGFFDSLLVSTNSSEIERIDEYGMLAGFLYDINFDSVQRENFSYEGVATRKMGNSSMQRGLNGIHTAVSQTSAAGNLTNAFHPSVNGDCTQYASFSLNSSTTSVQQVTLQAPAHVFTTGQRMMVSASHYLDSNCDIIGTTPTYNRIDGSNSNIATYGLALNNWSDVNNRNTTYPDFNAIGPCIKPFNPYMDCGDEFVFGRAPKLINGCPDHGTPHLSADSDQKNAKCDITKYIKTQRFYVPLMSTIFGILLPRENYKYIPMKYFPNLTFEFRLNPYAMYTNGYFLGSASGVPMPIVGQSYTQSQAQVPRGWIIKTVSLFVEQIYFDKQIDDMVDQQVNSGQCLIQTQGWQLGPIYQQPSTAAFKGEWQVNLGFDSLKAIHIMFYDQAYRTYSFCRKLFRSSINLTSLQLKFNNTYIPQQPIQGHGGNIYGTQTNTPYIIQLKQAFGRLWDVIDSTAINPYNFSLLSRVYNPTVKSTEGNYHTGGNINMLWERQVGKAVYSINVEGAQNDGTVWSGYNTQNIRPWSFKIDCDQINYYALTPTSMYIFCQYDYVFKIGQNGAFEIMGK